MWSCGCVFCVFIQVTSHCAWFIVGSIGHWSAVSSHLLKLFSRTIRFFNKQRLNSEELKVGLIFTRKIRCVFFSIPRQLLKCALQARDFLKAQHFSIWTAFRVWLEVHRWRDGRWVFANVSPEQSYEFRILDDLQIVETLCAFLLPQLVSFIIQ